MRTLLFTLTCLFSLHQLLGQGISFETTTWQEILQKAEKEQKPIFMDAYTQWCGPCKMMSKNVFPGEEVGNFYNENFINVKMDMETPEGEKLAAKYEVLAYPTLLFIDANGDILHRATGYHSVEQFVALGQTANNPEKRLAGIHRRYEKGDRSPAFLANYTAMLADAMDNKYLMVAEEYLKTQGDLGTSENMEFIMRYAQQPDSKGFTYFLDNKKVFQDKFGAPDVEAKIQNMLGTYIDTNPEVPFSEVEKLILRLYGSADGPRIAGSYKMAWHRQKGDRDGYAKSAVDYFKRFPSKSADELNEAAWTFYNVVEEKSMLKHALGWAQKSVKLEKSFYNTDTLAALYLKLGQKKKAIKTAKEAIDLARASGEDYTETQKILDAAYKL